MDRYCPLQSPYQQSATQVYLDYLRLKGLGGGTDERLRALELSPRLLSATELQEHHKRKSCLNLHEDDQRSGFEQIQTLETRAFTPLHECTFPPAKVNHGEGNNHRQLPGEIIPHARPKPRPCPLDLTSERLWQQQSLRPRREQRGYSEFEINDQKRRVARMSLLGQQYGEGAIPQTTHALRKPEPIIHLSQPTREAQEQPNETPACGQWVRKRTNNALLKVGARHEPGPWKVAQDNLENQKLVQQKREQQKVQLPAAKPGNLYPGPTRISGIPSPNHLVYDDNKEQITTPELAILLHLKSKMASQEAYRMYKEEKEEQRKASLSIPRSEITRTEPVKQLLASVNKSLEQKLEAAEVEAAKTSIAESDASRDQSPKPSKGPEDAYEACLKCGASFWRRYDESYPICGQPDGIHCPPSPESASTQALITSSDCRLGAKKSACDTGPFQRKVPLDSSRTNDLRAAVDAINKTSGNLLKSPKTTSAQLKPPLIEPSIGSISWNREKAVVHVAGLSRTMYKDSSIETYRHDVSPPPILQAEQTDMGSELTEEEEGGREAVEAVSQRYVDIQLEWEEVDDSLEDDEWSDIDQDLMDNVWTGSSSLSDMEWASDVASEGAFDF